MPCITMRNCWARRLRVNDSDAKDIDSLFFSEMQLIIVFAPFGVGGVLKFRQPCDNNSIMFQKLALLLPLMVSA